MSQQKDWLPHSGYSQCTKTQLVWRERERSMRYRKRVTETDSDRIDKIIEFVESKSVKIGLLK